MDQYQLSNIPQRFLSTQHYHSSLDQPNINNVEAKLYAIRQRNYQMAQNFFQQKYGQSSAYDQYLDENHMADLRPINMYEGQEEIDLRKLLRHKKEEIQRNQMQKINQNKNYTPAVDSHNQTNNRKVSKNNPWNDKNKITSNKNTPNSNNNRQQKIINKQYQNNPYDQNQNDYLNIQNQVIDLKQHKQQGKKGQFMNQFKQYLANKNKMKQNSHSPKDSPHKNINNTSLTKSKMMKTFESNMNNVNNMNHNRSNISQNKNVSQLLSQSVTSSISPQQQLVKKIFKNILKPSSPSHKPIPNKDYIQKIQLAQYLTQNQRILKILNTKPSQIIQKIQSQLSTKDPNKVYYHECLMFFYKLLGKQNQHKKLKAEYSFLQIPQGCILQPEVIKTFQKVFKRLDKHYDLIVKRLDYVEKLVMDQNLQKIINTPAVYETHLEKAVSLRRIFQRIQLKLKAFQYISWAQFMKYFQSGHTDHRKYDILRLVQSLKYQQKMGFVDIPETTMEVIIKSVKKLDKGQEFFNTCDLIGEILIDKIYEQEKYSFVRGKVGDDKSGNIPMETFEEVLKRIKQTAPKFVTVKQFLEFFSVKGEPVELVEKKINQEIKKNNDAVKITKFQDQYFQLNNQVDGYDSDPEFYNQSRVMGKKDFRKSMENNFKQSSSIKRGSELRPNDFHSNQKNNANAFKDHYKVTVPKPFNFQIRQQERAKQKMNRSLSLSDNRPKSQYKFKAKQIPQRVKQVGLLQQIMQQNQKKIQDRRKCSMLLTLANEQPFSFYNRKANKKTKQQRQQYQFKANPIPWYCSVNLLAKKQEQQINRNQKIARRAQQSLNKAKFPPRMQKDHQEKIARKNIQSNKNKKQAKTEHIIRAKQPPNFELLHKQFQSAMQRKRKQNKTTEVKQFNFKQVKREKKVQNDSQREQLSMINQNHQNKQQKWRQTLKSSINVLASSTAKFDQQVQKRRKQIQQKKKEQQKLRQQQQRRKVDQQLKQKLKFQTFKAQEKKLSQINQSKKQQMKRQQQNFKQMKAEWIKNAKKQPLLIERPLKRDQRLEKMKRLGQISQNLKKNGIKGKQHDGYFNREELLMLQDYEMLKKAEKI